MRKRLSFWCIRIVSIACCLVLTSTLCSTTAFAASPTASIRHQLSVVAAEEHYNAVNAEVHRVWHAIPGLIGFELDVDDSLKATEADGARKLVLIWKKTRPNISLEALPAEPIYRGPSQEKAVALMFNVSWGEDYLPSILSTLAKSHVQATFFVDGQFARKYPELVREISVHGHAIGSHGSGHPDFRKLDIAHLRTQVNGTNQVIMHIVGRKPILLAPPAGSYDARCVKLARDAGMYTILWTADTVDWRRPPAAAIISRALTGAAPGALILMHPTAPTAEALPELIRQLKRMGYRFKTVEQVVHEERVIAPPRTLSL